MRFLAFKVLTKKNTDEASDIQNTLEIIEQLLKGDTLEKRENNEIIHPKDENDLKNIEEEYSSYFDKDSNNSTKREGLEEVKEYLKEEMTHLPKPSESYYPKPLKTIPEEEEENSETEEVKSEKPGFEKDATSSDSKSSLIDFVLDKQKEELPPIGGGDDDC